ncbi:MAG: NAD+ synthase [Actinomycetota bacterium]|jgi:NAD+ synthase (glutamine-hydrolysing)|nr:NAD+ synthase [Actinomycetota bacterium]
MASLRLALCQLDATVGDLAGNADRVIELLATVEDAGCDLAIFPELVLTGYPPEDLLLEPGFIEESTRQLARVAATSKRCAAVVGYPHVDVDLHNAAAICAMGIVHGICHKVLLPNYGVFDEHRWFSPGRNDSPLFLIGGTRVGVAICEDVWSPLGPLSRLAAGGAELVVAINASPYRYGVHEERAAMLSTRALDASCALAYVNLVGAQDELVFDGGSMVFDANGHLVASVPQFAEATAIFDLEVRPAYRSRALEPRGRPTGQPSLAIVDVSPSRPAPAKRREPPLAPALGEAEEVYEALVTGVRDYVTKNGFGDVVIALSGGIDSALVTTVAADALGAARVHTVAMPSRYSSAHSLQDAAALATNLGVDHRTISIEPVHAAFLDLLEPQFAGRKADLTEENLQARCRGTILMALSNKFGWLVLTTGNKSEMAVGYATLYGDMAGGFAVIRDVPKTLVYRVCAHRNARAGAALIPQNILDKAPSAELRPDQRDEDSLPPYAVLDPILEGYVESDLSVGELVERGHDESTVRRVIELVDRAEYKRRQAPPGVRVTSRAFGKDRRMPITSRFRPWEQGR